jgi:hypothetical protein
LQRAWLPLSVCHTRGTHVTARCALPVGFAGGWRARTTSAITNQHQGNGFDCGVACLLYAEKCGQDQEKEDIGLYTDQDEITWYRNLLKEYFDRLRA